MIRSFGNSDIDDIDDANVPVNSFYFAPEAIANNFQESDFDAAVWPFINGHHIWVADNFMPRRGYIANDQYLVSGESREEIAGFLAVKVIPLYTAALYNLSTKLGNYYWEIEKPKG